MFVSPKFSLTTALRYTVYGIIMTHSADILQANNEIYLLETVVASCAQTGPWEVEA